MNISEIRQFLKRKAKSYGYEARYILDGRERTQKTDSETARLLSVSAMQAPSRQAAVGDL